MISKDEPISDEHTLEFLLAFDGRIHHLERGFWLKFEIKRGLFTPQRPHGFGMLSRCMVRRETG
jgi:hypothetical protein